MNSESVVIPKLKLASSPQKLPRNRHKLEHRITIRLNDEYYNELLKVSHRDGFTVSNIVRHLVNRFIEQERLMHYSTFRGNR